MALFIAWLVVPLVLVALSLGCGLLVERAAGLTLPGALLLPLGLALVIVEADLVTMTSATAQLATPLAVALAVAGYGLADRRGRRLDGWALGCRVGVFAVYAAPIVLSGQATFAGYITLDDTSSWFALTDRAMEHGRSVAGLAPSTYQQVLTDLLHTSGYPLGAFMPLGHRREADGPGHRVAVPADDRAPRRHARALPLPLSARLVSSEAAPDRRRLPRRPAGAAVRLFALERNQGARRRCPDRARLRCVVATIGRWQSLRATAPLPSPRPRCSRFSAPPEWCGCSSGTRARRHRFLFPRAVGRPPGWRSDWSGLIALLSIPSISIARSFIKGASGGEITSSTEVANLGHPLDTLQVFGIWPATDFRDQPAQPGGRVRSHRCLCSWGRRGRPLAWRRRALECRCTSPPASAESSSSSDSSEWASARRG